MAFFFGGLSKHLNELFFLNIEISEIIKFSFPKPWDDVSFLTDLYLKKGWSIRRISRELGCNKSVVRKKLSETGSKTSGFSKKDCRDLTTKVQLLRQRGLSYQKIADLLNLWRVETISGDGKWHAKTVRDCV